MNVVVAVRTRYRTCMQRGRTGTAGTTTFCCSGTGTATGMHRGTVFGSESNIKWNTKVKKIKNERPTFLEAMLPMTSKRQDLVQIFLLKNFARYCLVPGNGTKTFPKSEPEPEPQYSFRSHNTALYVCVTVKLVSSVTLVVRL